MSAYNIIIIAFITEAIIQKIEESGFKVSLSSEQHLTKEVAAQLYADHQGSEFFEHLTDFMSRYVCTLLYCHYSSGIVIINIIVLMQWFIFIYGAHS